MEFIVKGTGKNEMAEMSVQEGKHSVQTGVLGVQDTARLAVSMMAAASQLCACYRDELGKLEETIDDILEEFEDESITYTGGSFTL